MNSFASPSHRRAPTLELRELRLRGPLHLLEAKHLTTHDKNLACVGEAATLLHACVDPSLILEGHLLCLGEPARDLLGSRSAGYAPRQLPGSAQLRVDEALLLSASLVSLGKNEVERALEFVGASALRRKRISTLNLRETRLVSLAHGLTGDPGALLLEDPFVGLENTDARLLAPVIERALDSRRFVVSVESDSVWSKRLLDRADEALVAVGSTLRGPFAPKALPLGGYLLHTTPSGSAWRDALRARGAQITETLDPSVLLVRGLDAQTLTNLARDVDEHILELCPLPR